MLQRHAFRHGNDYSSAGRFLFSPAAAFSCSTGFDVDAMTTSGLLMTPRYVCLFECPRITVKRAVFDTAFLACSGFNPRMVPLKVIVSAVPAASDRIDTHKLQRSSGPLISMHRRTSELMMTPFPFVTRMSSRAPAIIFRLASLDIGLSPLPLLAAFADRIAAP